MSKRSKRQFELLGGASVLTASALVISIFLLTSLDKILIQSNQFASVIASVLVDLTNGDRHSNDLGGLTVSPVLVAAAEAKAADMVAKGYFAHTSPEGLDPWYWFEKVGYEYAYAGENLAVDFTDSGDVVRAWMNSPLHRDNLLNEHYTEIGIATASGFYQGRPTTFVVQMFGTPASPATSQGGPASHASQGTPAAPEERVATAQEEQGDATPIPVAVVPVPEQQVLGESAAEREPVAQAAQQPSKKQPVGAIGNSPEMQVEWVLRQSSLPERLVATPKSASQFMYYLLAFLVLVALAVDTGLELRWHHQKKAARAAFLLILIAAFFVAGNYYVFTTPSVPATGVASAASAVR